MAWRRTTARPLMCSPPFRQVQLQVFFFSWTHGTTRDIRQSKLTFPCAMSQEDASSSFTREAEARAADGEDGDAARDPPGRRFRSGSSATDPSSNASSINYRKARPDTIGGGFWCGVLCMHLPGLSSRRRSMQQQQSMSLSEAEADTRASTAGPAATRSSTVSKAASMERFKYSSSSSGIVLDRAGEEEEEVSAYFDLPLELLRISSVDTESPVTAAFVFDGDRGRGAKKIVLPELSDVDFSFPAPPAFSSPSSPKASDSV